MIWILGFYEKHALGHPELIALQKLTILRDIVGLSMVIKLCCDFCQMKTSSAGSFVTHQGMPQFQPNFQGSFV